jgi:hypothetical protein
VQDYVLFVLGDLLMYFKTAFRWLFVSQSGLLVDGAEDYKVPKASQAS